MPNQSLSIIVPAFNEQARIGESLRKILAYMREKTPSAELLVVDDGSTDSTLEIAEQICGEFADIETKVIGYEKNRGKGFAVKKGLVKSSGDIAVFTDADLSTPIEELPKLIEPIAGGAYHITFGSRALDRSLIGTHQPWRREQGGKVFNLIVKTLTGLPFWDTQCGFKAFNMKKFRPLLKVMQIDRFGFDVEFLYVAHFHGLRLKEIPVRWNDVAGSKLGFINGLPAFAEVNKIRRNAKRGVYDRKHFQHKDTKDTEEI